jgi:hypothetical protein
MARPANREGSRLLQAGKPRLIQAGLVAWHRCFGRMAFDQSVAAVADPAAAAFGAGWIGLLAMTGFADHVISKATLNVADSQLGQVCYFGR